MKYRITAFLLLSLCDLLLTSYLFHLYGSEMEANPIAKLVMINGSIGNIVVYKCFFVALFLCLVFVIRRKNKRYARNLVSLSALIVGIVVSYTIMGVFI